MSDQDGISPYNTNKIASRQEFGMQKNINYRIIVDPLLQTVERVTIEILGVKALITELS